MIIAAMGSIVTGGKSNFNRSARKRVFKKNPDSKSSSFNPNAHSASGKAFSFNPNPVIKTLPSQNETPETNSSPARSIFAFSARIDREIVHLPTLLSRAMQLSLKKRRILSEIFDLVQSFECKPNRKFELISQILSKYVPHQGSDNQSKNLRVSSSSDKTIFPAELTTSDAKCTIKNDLVTIPRVDRVESTVRDFNTTCEKENKKQGALERHPAKERGVSSVPSCKLKNDNKSAWSTRRRNSSRLSFKPHSYEKGQSCDQRNLSAEPLKHDEFFGIQNRVGTQECPQMINSSDDNGNLMSPSTNIPSPLLSSVPLNVKLREKSDQPPPCQIQTESSRSGRAGQQTINQSDSLVKTGIPDFLRNPTFPRYCDVYLNGNKFKTLLDSGNLVSNVINEETASKLGLTARDIEPIKGLTRIGTAKSGTHLQVLGIVRTPLTLSFGRRCPYTFATKPLVCRGLNMPLNISGPFMRLIKLDQIHSEGAIRVKGHQFSLREPVKTRKNSRIGITVQSGVHIAQPETIPAKSGCFIDAIVMERKTGRLPVGEGVVIPHPSFSQTSNLVPTRCSLVNVPEDGIIQICVLNTDDKPIKLK